MKITSVGFVLSALLTLALAANLEEQTEINDNEEDVTCFDSEGNAYQSGETYTEGDKVCTCTTAGVPDCASQMAHTEFCNICKLQPETGPCRAAFRRYYYNVNRRTCLRFIYGGCRGNKNNFRTFRACMRRCKRRAG